MKYRTLGKTGMKVSVIGVGTWQLGGEWGKMFSQNEVDLIFGEARQLGINLIDTAECYGDHLSEALIGNSVSGDRGNWIIATKFGHRYHGHMNRTDERSAADAVAQLELSLKALRTDYVDLLQYHSVRNGEYDNDLLTDALLKLKQAGKVRHIGASISPNTNIHQVREAPHRQVEVIQVLYNRLDRQAEQDVLPECQRQNLGVLARVPLASGYLSGKYKPGKVFSSSDVRAGHDPAGTEAKLREVEQIARTEVPPGVPMAQWALAWCLQHPAVSAVIPGCKDVAQVMSNACAAELLNS